MTDGGLALYRQTSPCSLPAITSRTALFEAATGATAFSADVSGTKAVALFNTSTQPVTVADGFAFARPDQPSQPLRSVSLSLPGFKFRTVELDLALAGPAGSAPPLSFAALDPAGHLLGDFSYGAGELAGQTILSFMLRSTTADIARVVIMSMFGNDGGIAQFGHIQFSGVTALGAGERPPPTVPIPASGILLLTALAALTLLSRRRRTGATDAP